MLQVEKKLSGNRRNPQSDRSGLICVRLGKMVLPARQRSNAAWLKADDRRHAAPRGLRYYP
jgi:hypothetical protein